MVYSRWIVQGTSAASHVKNFIEGVLGRTKVIAPATLGQQAAIRGHMATLSFRQGKKIVWDEAANKYHFV